uniref:Uncharacterized protein n=1 Tax=Anguilla anguilla TaxID=7936 RepID=A0A0E9PQT6_ANGAN
MTDWGCGPWNLISCLLSYL